MVVEDGLASISRIRTLAAVESLFEPHNRTGGAPLRETLGGTDRWRGRGSGLVEADAGPRNLALRAKEACELLWRTCLTLPDVPVSRWGNYKLIRDA